MTKSNLKIIHVNQFVIRHNKKYGNKLPPCRVQIGSKSRYCKDVVINGPSKMVYRPNDPLSCGAKLWVETEASVTLIDEVLYSQIKEDMDAIRNG